MSGSIMLVALLAILAAAAASAQQVRVCVPFPADGAYLSRCDAFFSKNVAPSADGLTFVCVPASSGRDCVTKLKAREAHIGRFGGDDLYVAGAEQGLTAIAAEEYGNNFGASYYGVALVRKSFCDGRTPALSDLRNQRLCTTGYRRGAGWSIPMGAMLAQGLLPAVDADPSIENDAESVAAFFSTVCAPGVTAEGPASTLSGSGRYNELCANCKDPVSCLRNDTYADYTGAFTCLKAGAADVAFTRHDIALADTSINQDDYRLLCRQGGCRPLNEFDNCNIAKSAAHAVVAGPALPLADRPKVAAALIAAASTAAGLSAAQDLNTLSGTTTTPVPFFLQRSAKAVRAITEPSFPDFFGPSAVAAFKAIREVTVPPVRFCTVSTAEQAFCEQVVANMNVQGLGFKWGCVMRASTADCIAAVKGGQADALTADGADIYAAQKAENGLKVIAAEDYGLAGTQQQMYYSVAVVPKAFCDSKANVTLADLRGKRSCHTGYKRSAGWAVPVGYMVGTGIMPVPRHEANVQDDAEAVSKFFSSSCAGRTADNGPIITPDGNGKLWEPLCSACKAGDANRCTTQDPYYDYAGAFRCLVENSGDVAFTKHTTVMDYSQDGSAAQAWSTRPMSDFRLLCRTGGCQPVTKASTCHLSQVPAHAIMVRSSYPQTRLLKLALEAASKDPVFVSLAFNRTANPNNLLFKSSAVAITAVNDDTRAFLGSAYFIYQGLEAFSDGGPAPAGRAEAPGPSSSGGNGLSGGAIAGIVVGCSVGTALIAVLIVVVIMRRRRGGPNTYAPYADGNPYNSNNKSSSMVSATVALSSNVHGTPSV